MQTHKIRWTQRTWNPIIGCSPISPGCANCYAQRQAARLAHMPQTADRYAGLVDDRGHWTGETRLVESALTQPHTWTKPTVVFVGSMTDLFHENTPFADIDRVLQTIYVCMEHRFILLTKRPHIMMQCLERWHILPANVIFGFTAEDQQRFDARWYWLGDLPEACTIMVSHEPALGPITYPQDFLARGQNAWIVTGGESGPGARPMHPAWPRHDRDQAATAGIPFFFKQWGEWREAVNVIPSKSFCWVSIDGQFSNYGLAPDACMLRVGKKRAGHLLDNIDHHAVPSILDLPLPAKGRGMGGEVIRTCRVCGCTDDDCRQCIEKTGAPCYWVEDDLCSACREEAQHAL